MRLFSKSGRPLRARGRKGSVKPRVELFESRLLLATYVVTNNTDSGPGSLRQAILNSNGTAGTNSINFNISVGSIAETPIPTSDSGPNGITTGPDGNLWFTEGDANQIGRLTPSGSFTEYPIPTPDSEPTSITTGPDGNLWFTEYAANQIGRITPSGSFTEFPLLTANSYPADITTGPDGNLWFTEQLGGTNEDGAIGRITPAGTITEFPIPGGLISGPFGITNGPDGNLWFTESVGGPGARNDIGSITPTGTITQFPIPTAAGGTPIAITTGPDGNLWFTDIPANQIVRLTPSGSFTEFAIPTANSYPVDIASGPDGNLWFTEANGNQIGRITPAGTITEFPVATAESFPYGITSGPDGGVWFTEADANNIGRVTTTTIMPLSPLPTITNPVVIDGYTQPGSSPNTLPDGDNAVLQIELNGAYAGAGSDGLLITAGSSTVEGLVINQFMHVADPTSPTGFSGGNAIVLQTNGGNTIEGNFLGTDAQGTDVLPNQGDGVLVDLGSSSNTIGGTAPAARNVISGNFDGISIGGETGAVSNSPDNLIEGNFIGTDATGTISLGNSRLGVQLDSSSGNIVGGTVAGAGNVISGNASDGISLQNSGTSDTIVQGNLIGTNVTGTVALGNGGDGIIISFSVNTTNPSSFGNTIGGTSAAARNIIAANQAWGIGVVAAFGGGTKNLIEGNYVGTNATGSAALANMFGGIDLGALANTVGGTATGAGNLISGNTYDGIYIDPSGGSELIEGNFIGTDATGFDALPNGADGVELAASNNTIGGTAFGAVNVISGNAFDGIFIDLSGGSELILGNFIGTDADGFDAIPNGADGVEVAGSNNTIGGTAFAAQNVISGNMDDGIDIDPSGGSELVEGNLIGLVEGGFDLGSGFAAMPNGDNGVDIAGSNSTIGGTALGAGNTISGNAVYGVFLSGPAAAFNVIEGNDVGTTPDGNAPLPNARGVDVESGAHDNTIGGTVSGAGNVLSGNNGFAGSGVMLFGAGSGQLIAGNLIGVGADGSTEIPNSTWGVIIQNTPGTTVGGTVAAARNVISGNTQGGMLFAGSGTTSGLAVGNFIGLDAAGTAARGNNFSGIYVGDGSVFNPPSPGSATNVTIGGLTATPGTGPGNVISANGNYGIWLHGAGTSGVLVQGNEIGTDVTGHLALGNAFDGISVSAGATNNTIGGTAGAPNVISSNDQNGVEISGTGTSGNLVEGNKIGTDVAGTLPLGNSNDGVSIDTGATKNTIGGLAGAANVISANVDGVEISGSGTGGIVVEGNYIGTDTGLNPLGNQVGVLALNSNGNTIGGTVAGNTIGFNTQQGVSVVSGIQNKISQNLYVGTNGPNSPVQSNDISLIAGGNNNLTAPTLQTASINGPNLVVEETGVPGGAILELYQLTSAAPGRRTFLGSNPVTSVGGILTVSIPAGAVSNGAQIVATGTVAANGTSPFSAVQTVADLYVVINTNPSGAGSLNQAILNANAHAGQHTISFAILGPAPYVIQPTAALPLPTITGPVVIDGTTEAGVVIDGNALSQDGFVLGAGSGGSTIKGLTIRNFAGAAIDVRSNNDIIQQDVLGASGLGNQVGVLIDGGSNNVVGGATSALANTIVSNSIAGVEISGAAVTGNLVESNYIGTNAALVALGNQVGVSVLNSSGNTIGGTGVGNTIGFNIQQGVSVVSGIQNVISQNLYVGANGPISPVQSNDISLSFGGNNNQSAPTLLNAAIMAGNLAVQVSGVPVGATVELYQLKSGSPSERTFLGSGLVTLVNTVPTVTISAGSLSSGSEIAGTATVAANGTSAFSAMQTIAPLFVVTNTNQSGVGSLYQAIINSNSNPGLNMITFAIPGSMLVIEPSSAFPLVVLNNPVVIDGTSEPGVVIDGGGLAQNGFVLGAGSSGSTIQGLTIQDFTIGAAIDVLSNGNTIQQDVLGAPTAGNQVGVLINGGSNNVIGGGSASAANTIVSNSVAGVEISGAAATSNVVENNYIGTNAALAIQSDLGNSVGVLIVNSSGNTIGGSGTGNAIGNNTQQGVSVVTGTQNVISQNLYVGTNGIASPIQANDISLTSGGNNNQVAPTLGNVALSGNTLTLQVYETAVTPTPQTLQIYQSTAAQRSFLISELVTLSNDPNDPTVVTATVSGLTSPASIIAAVTDPTNGTSPFSAAATTAPSLTTVTSPTESALSNAIIAANSSPGSTITFSFPPGVLPQILITSELPHITAAMTTIDGTSASGGQGVQINGVGGYGMKYDGLTFDPTSSGSTITGLDIANFNGFAIVVESTGDTITNNFIGSGSSVLGVGSAPGNQGGIMIGAGGDTTIGGTPTASSDGIVHTLSALANTISGNAGDGILIQDSSAPNSIMGNLITGNALNGVDVVGDLTGDEANLVTISQNFIGIDSDGESAFVGGAPTGNGLSGILLSNNKGTNTVPGSTAVMITGNVISANGSSGVTARTMATPFVTANIADNIIGLDQSGEFAVTANPASMVGPPASPLGNALDGVLIDNVVGVMVGGTMSPGHSGDSGNVISGNLGRGIEIEGDVATTESLDGQQNTIQENYIGTDISGQLGVNYAAGQMSGQLDTLGNLSDGIFLFVPHATQVLDNVISNNRATGIHVATQAGSNTPTPTGALTILGNYIGTDKTGKSDTDAVHPMVLIGNGSDGIFLDNITSGTTIGGTTSAALNVISGNRANGVDLLNSSAVSIVGDMIGTDVSGTNSLGNASNGVFLNESDGNQIGSSAIAAMPNVISGNLGSGVFISGTSFTQPSVQQPFDNTIQNNFIGTDSMGGTDQGEVPNHVAGIIVSGSSYNLISSDVISANLLDGILLANSANYNSIMGNKIGTDVDGTTMLGNTANGVFLVGGQATTDGMTMSAMSMAKDNTISGNVISGNAEDGVQIFGAQATGNSVTGNTIGLGADGMTSVPNGGNGVYLNDAGAGNMIGGTAAADANVISGNKQSGVLIGGTYEDGGGNFVERNKIGTNSGGSSAVANDGNGIFIYGTPSNQVTGNLISGNAQAGVTIFSPAPSAIGKQNWIAGNMIGTDASGTAAIPNQSDGVDIFSGVDNTIGGSSNAGNVISGNAANGVLITQVSDVPATANVLEGNYIGTDFAASKAIPNRLNGVLVSNAWTPNSAWTTNAQIPTGVKVGPNRIGCPGVTQIIAGNTQAGVQFIGYSAANLVQGDDLEVEVRVANKSIPLGNGLAGVIINNVQSAPNVNGSNLNTASSNETIGGMAAAGGNIISGSVYGVEVLGSQIASQNNLIQHNWIGLDDRGNAAGNNIGIFVQNSAGNTIGGSSPAARNVISANSSAGIEITGQYASLNSVQGNYIGTDVGGTRSAMIDPSTALPTQTYGVYLLSASKNTVGGFTSRPGTGAGNLISGNLVGIDIVGQNSVGQSGTQGVPIGANLVLGNAIGTDSSGMNPVPNYEYGVYLNNSGMNTVGGTTAGSRNLISANGIDGVEIFGGITQASSQKAITQAQEQGNVVEGNYIGTNVNGTAAFTSPQSKAIPIPGEPSIYLGVQLYGVVVIGSSANMIGGTAAAGNRIDGNFYVGVYLSRRDFQMNVYTVPTGNPVLSNMILNNGIYGVLRYDCPNNLVAEPPQRDANTFAGNRINLADYITGLTNKTPLPTPPSKYQPTAAKKGPHSRAKRPKAQTAAAVHHPRVSSVRPHVPALFAPGVKTKVVPHVSTHDHR